MRLRLVVLCAALVTGCGSNPFKPYTQTDPVDSSYSREVEPGRFLVAVLATDAARAARIEAILVEALAAGGGGTFTKVGPDPALEDHAFGPGGPYALRHIRVARYSAQLRAVGLDVKEPIDLVWKAGPEPRTLRANSDAVKLTVRGSGEFQLVIEGGDLQCRGTDLVRTRTGRGFRERVFELRSGAKPIAVEVLADEVTTAAPALFYEVKGFGGDVKALLTRLVEKQHHDAQGVTSYRMAQTTVWLEEEASVGSPPPSEPTPVEPGK